MNLFYSLARPYGALVPVYGTCLTCWRLSTAVSGKTHACVQRATQRSDKATVKSKWLPELCQHRLAFRNITYTVKAKGQNKVILHDIGATVDSGRVLAIMGLSGAGKTSLLNVLTLTAFSGRSEGTVQLNGSNMSLQKFQRCCALVTQNNFHLGVPDTEGDTQLRRRPVPGRERDEKRDRVEALLSSLGLTSCADTVVGTSSRLVCRWAIAPPVDRLALIKRPTVLFLDEPTSGLDAAAAVGVMDCIRELAKSSNLVVICTIHQPSTVVYNSFDQVMLLAGGAVAFRGTADEAVPYFASIGHAMPNHSNPAEFMLNLVNDEFSDPKQVAAVMGHWAKNRSDGTDPTLNRRSTRRRAAAWRWNA